MSAAKITPAAAEAIEYITGWIDAGGTGGDFWVYDTARAERFPGAERFVATAARWIAGTERTDLEAFFTTTAPTVAAALEELEAKLVAFDGGERVLAVFEFPEAA